MAINIVVCKCLESKINLQLEVNVLVTECRWFAGFRASVDVVTFTLSIFSINIVLQYIIVMHKNNEFTTHYLYQNFLDFTDLLFEFSFFIF